MIRKVKSVNTAVPVAIWELMCKERELSCLSFCKMVEQAIELYCSTGGAAAYRKFKETKNKKS